MKKKLLVSLSLAAVGCICLLGQTNKLQMVKTHNAGAEAQPPANQK